MNTRSTPQNAHAITETINLDDAPTMPTLRLVLKTPKEKNHLYNHLKDFFNNSTEFNMFSKKEKEKILKQVARDGYLTEESIQKMNNHIDEDFQKVFEKYKNQLMQVLKINPGDTPEIAMVKVKMAKAVAESLRSIFKWISEKLDQILRVKDIKTRSKLTDQLFQKLDKIMEQSWDEKLMDAAYPFEQERMEDGVGPEEEEKESGTSEKRK